MHPAMFLDDDEGLGNLPFDVFSGGGSVGGTGHSTRNAILGISSSLGGKFLDNFYGARAAKSTGVYIPTADYINQTRQPLQTTQGSGAQLTDAELKALANRDGGGSGIGLGIDGKGIRLSDGSHIGWLPIVGVVGAIMLLQSKPVGRK